MLEIFTWMMLLPKIHTKFTKDNFYVPFDSRFFLVQEHDIFEIYQINRNSDMIHVYFWKYTEQGIKTNKSHFYDKRINMLGENMIMQRNDEVGATHNGYKSKNKFIQFLLLFIRYYADGSQNACN